MTFKHAAHAHSNTKPGDMEPHAGHFKYHGPVFSKNSVGIGNAHNMNFVSERECV